MSKHVRNDSNTPAARRLGWGRGGLLAAVVAQLCWACCLPPAQAQDLAFGDSVSTEQLMADQLIAMAWSAFGREQEPREDQLVRAEILLDMAVKLAPQDEGMWQLRASLARAIEDQEMLTESLRAYLRLVPKDDTAQLELIRTKLSGVEALDDYLRMLEGMLRSESVSGLSAPLRSRLATLAAQAAQEIGDNARYAAWLGYAVKLDPVNPDAARMVYLLTLDREGTSRQRGAALVGMLKASPVEPSVRVALGEVLMREGVYAQAAEQFGVAMELSDIQSRMELLAPYALCLIASGQGDQVPSILQDLQLFLKRMADAQAARDDPEAEPEQTLDFEDLPALPSSLEFARLILMYDNNPVAAADSFKKLRIAVSEEGNPAGELVWVASVFNQELAWAREQVKTLAQDDKQALLARGWLALRGDDPERARVLFEQLSEEDPFARLGLASMPGLTDKQRTQAYQELIWSDPTSMAAVVVAHKLHQMDQPVSPTGEGVPLRVLVDDLPRQLWTPALAAAPWVRMTLKVSPGSFSYLQPMFGHVTVRNSTRIPLSVGPGGAIQAPLMIINAPSIRSEPLGQLQPTFFNMGRRLSLEPGAAIEADIRLDRFDLGQLAALYPTVTITYSASAMLDPRPLPNGGVLPGPLGATFAVGSLQARGLPATPSNIQIWIAELDATDQDTRAVAIARLLVVAGQPAESTEAIDLRTKISELVSQRFPTFDPLMQAWTTRFMTPDADGEPVSRHVIDLAKRSNEPMVRIVYLVTQATSPDSPALTDAMRHDDPTIRTFAQALKEGLELDAQRQRELEQEQEPQQPLGQDDPFGGSNDFPPLELPGLDAPSDNPWLP